MELVKDIGISFKAFIDCETATLEEFRGWSRVSDTDWDNLLSWTGVRLADVKMQFRGEEFGTRSIRSPVMRGCPLCLAEDIQMDKGNPLQEMHLRGEWQIRWMHTCQDHDLPLVTLWEERTVRRRYNIFERFKELRPSITAENLQLPKEPKSTFEGWLFTRLLEGNDDTWFSDKSLYASAYFCDLLGGHLQWLRSGQVGRPKRNDRDALSIGFEASAFGLSDLEIALEEMASFVTSGRESRFRAFGDLYYYLDGELSGKQEFEPFREALRNFVSKNWIFTPGDMVLGRPYQESKSHSVTSAAQNLSIAPNALRKLLVEKGVIDHDDPRTNQMCIFDAQEHSAILETISKLISPPRMRQLIGASKSDFAQLVAEEIIVPWQDLPWSTRQWVPEVGQNFLGRLEAHSTPVQDVKFGYKKLSVATLHAGSTLAETLALIFSGQLSLVHPENDLRFSSFLVDSAELLSLVQSKRSQDVGSFSLAEFGRRIGIREEGFMNDLHAAGIIKAEHAPDRRGRQLHRVSDTQIRSFLMTFCTVRNIVDVTDHHRNTILAKLRAKGIQCVSFEERNFSGLFYRKDVESVFPDTSGVEFPF